MTMTPQQAAGSVLQALVGKQPFRIALAFAIGASVGGIGTAIVLAVRR